MADLEAEEEGVLEVEERAEGQKSLLIPISIAGLLLVWGVVLLNKSFTQAEARAEASGNVEVPAKVISPNVPYTEATLKSMNLPMAAPSGEVRRRPVAIKPDGTIEFEEVLPEDAEDQPGAAYGRAGSPPVTKMSPRARKAALKAQQSGGAEIKARDITITEHNAAFAQELSESGQLQRVLDEQYEQMMKKLNAGYGPEGGPSREQIERMRNEGVIRF